MMDRVRLTKRAADWLEATDQFRVLHDFEQVVNLINGSGAVLSVHTADIGMGPFTVQLDRQAFRVVVEGGGTISSLRSQIKPAPFDHYGGSVEFWDARPDWGLFTADMLVPVSHTLSADVEQAMHTLHEAIFLNNEHTICQSAQYLVGRGVGLTPTGDDVLMGTIFALHVLGWDQAIIEMLGEQAAGKTTSLSAAFLQAAVAGEATEPWHQLLRGEPDALKTLLALGDTSGKDGWTGFVNMLQRHTGRLA